jgi:hypothetical protein
LEDQLLQPPQGWCWFAIVKKVPGANLRMFVANEPTVETGLDAPDDLAEAIWENRCLCYDCYGRDGDRSTD